MVKNAERSAATRARLMAVARELFARHGYAGAGTEAILQKTELGRGALYHHFADKSALFEAVCLELCEEAVAAIDAATSGVEGAYEGLVEGSIAWIAFTTRSEVRQILMIDAPTVLGWARWEALDRKLSYAMLCDALAMAVAAGELAFSCDLELAAAMVNGALNGLALRVTAPGAGVTEADWHAAVHALFAGFRP